MMQGIITAILLLAFLAGVVWLFAIRKRADFDAAARLPLESDSAPREDTSP
jgi:cytochrome c oxidase cbb3-type subunit 4